MSPDVLSGNLPSTPDFTKIESHWRDRWDASQIFRFDPDCATSVFSVDTPPPYISAAHLHVGHAMSYAQADFVVRYRRMRGDNVFYPMGFDDNGLPTERFVERKYGINKRTTTRSEFRALCLTETQLVARVYEDLWRSLGLSVDWSLSYSTIDDHCRRTSQLAFVKLYRAGRIYRTSDPVFWDPVLGTALAQADLEPLERKSSLHNIAFSTLDSSQPLIISTTRPELLPACVALFCHPDDSRYHHLVGSQARSPLFNELVPILADQAVDPNFGTGLMMVCTFGDAEDVRRWRENDLPTRLVVDEDGRLGTGAGAYARLRVEDARRVIVADLANAGALVSTERVRQRVAVSERSGAPVEFAMRPQWFLRVLDLKEELLSRARQLEWHPEWMQQRLVDWITGLRYDWNLSRQRYYGVPVPVWLCRACGHPYLPKQASLPVDPLEDTIGASCERCGGKLEGDPDVLDTWMTSSCTPQILTNWAGTPGRRGLDDWPLTVRMQAHDIIRTWLFYTVLQAHLHQDSIPWKHVMVSGWGLNEQGKRISKRDLDPANPERFRAYDPHSVIANYGADALRHWAARATIGQDVRYSEKDVRSGRKIVVKLWNIARFCEPHLVPPSGQQIATVEDRWILQRTNKATLAATHAFNGFDYAAARQTADDLLWTFADDWLELAKHRMWYPERHPEAAASSAGVTMHSTLRTIIGLFAPFLPFVTEELYHRLFAAEEGHLSLHRSAWPEPFHDSLDTSGIELVHATLRASRSIRTDRRWSQSVEVATAVLDVTDPALRSLLEQHERSIIAATRAAEVAYGPADRPTDVAGLALDLRGVRN